MVRRILHCDMDCFYAAVHMRDDPSLRGKPVVVGGRPDSRGVVAAASYEARAFGIRSAMPSSQAARLCAHVVFLRPDFPRYSAESQQIFAIFRRFTPLVQPASLDEAYLDVSDHLGAYPTATAVARAIRQQVRDERQLTVSVGVGPNRLVAKIASDFHKPDGLTVVPPAKVPGFLAPLAVRALHGVGPATARVLEAMGARTVAELRSLSLQDLCARFGRHGQGLWNYARGIDERPVETSGERKSLGTENTYGKDLSELAAMDAELGTMADEVARGLVRRELRARTITVKVRFPDFTTLTRGRTLPRPTASAPLMAELARELLRATEAGRRQVRLLGLSASNLVAAGDEPQLDLFSEPSTPAASAQDDHQADAG
jgi:DNA polymerase-4